MAEARVHSALLAGRGLRCLVPLTAAETGLTVLYIGEASALRSADGAAGGNLAGLIGLIILGHPRSGLRRRSGR